MWEWMLARMVERALPPHIADADQERIAAEAAENAIRQNAWVAAFAGVLLLALAGTMLYRYLPNLQTGHGQLEASRALTELVGDNSKLRQANEDLQQKLDDVTKELQGKMSALEGQVADLGAKLQAAKESAAKAQTETGEPKEVLQPSKRLTGPIKAPVAAGVRSTYQCGDGRAVRDPARCQDTSSPAAPDVGAAPPGVYQCGDGRTTHDPAECKATASPLEPRE